MSAADLQPGMRLARDVTNERGQVLLHEGVVLTPAYIDRLQRLGLPAVAVIDPFDSEVDPGPALSERLRAETTTQILRAQVALERTSGLLADRPVSAVRAFIRNDWKPDFEIDALRHQINRLIGEVVEHAVYSALASMRSADSYLFDHAVDSTVLAIMLGKRLGLEPDRLKALALGGLVHDLGMAFVPAAILQSPAPLAGEALERVRAHPELGFEILERVESGDYLPEITIAHQIVYQHHEREDGSGYPRQLKGSRRIVRWGAPEAEAGAMILEAEILAVADVYTTLIADRPYRKALELPAAMITLRQESGRTFKREIVDHLRHLVPIYPLGAPVAFVNGKLMGYRGVVCRFRVASRGRPIVRVTHDAAGKAITPFEVDLQRDDSEIASIA